MKLSKKTPTPIKKLQSLIKKPIFLLILLIILLIIYRFISQISPQTEHRFNQIKVPSSQFAHQPDPNTQTSINIPPSALNSLPSPVYVYQLPSLSHKQMKKLVQPLLETLNITTQPKTEKYANLISLIYNNQKAKFEVNSQGQIYYKLNPITVSATKSLNQSQLTGLASQYLKNWGLDAYLSSPQIKYYFILGNQIRESNSFKDSNLITFIYQPIINQIPLIGLGPSEPPVEIQTDKSGKITQFRYFLPSLNQAEKSTYPLKSQDQLKTALNNKKFTIIKSKLQGQEKNIFAHVFPEDIKSANFSKIKIVYQVLAKKQEYLQPMFILEGTAQTKDNNSADITISLPAVSSEWIKQ